MSNAALATSVVWPQIPGAPIDTYSEHWRRECLARHLAHSGDDVFISWEKKHERTPAFLLDIANRMQLEFDACAQARELLRTVPHREIRNWLQTLSTPHRSVWTERFTREKQALKEAENGCC